MLEARIQMDEERIVQVEGELEVVILFGEEADRKYEEVRWPTQGGLKGVDLNCIGVTRLTHGLMVKTSLPSSYDGSTDSIHDEGASS